MPLNTSKLLAKLSTLLQVETIAAKAMKTRFEFALNTLLQEFDSHPVTKELDNGPTAANISGTLGGRGNLFSFIGFPANSKPTDELRQILASEIRLVPRDRRIEGGLIKYNYRTIIPEDRIRRRTPMPFESGNSWAYSIETGISGFSQYVYSRLNNEFSRSGHGIQREGVNLGGTYQPTPYISELLNNFRLRLRTK